MAGRLGGGDATRQASHVEVLVGSVKSIFIAMNVAMRECRAGIDRRGLVLEMRTSGFGRLGGSHVARQHKGQPGNGS